MHGGARRGPCGCREQRARGVTGGRRVRASRAAMHDVRGAKDGTHRGAEVRDTGHASAKPTRSRTREPTGAVDGQAGTDRRKNSRLVTHAPIRPGGDESVTMTRIQRSARCRCAQGYPQQAWINGGLTAGTISLLAAGACLARLIAKPLICRLRPRIDLINSMSCTVLHTHRIGALTPIEQPNCPQSL